MRYYLAEKPWGDILPRYTFLEPLYTGKAVLEIGCGDGTGALFLRNSGAASVWAVDADGPALAAALNRTPREGVSFGPFDGKTLKLPSSSMDVIVDFDLAQALEDGKVAEIARVLRPRGVLITSLANPGYRPLATSVREPPARPPVAFERFVAFLQKHFQRVSVVGQTPFLGFSIGWIGAEAQDQPLEMDSVLLPGGAEEVAYYLVICGREAVSFTSQSLVQLPYRAVAEEVSSLAQFRPAAEAGRTPPADAATVTGLERRLQDASRIAEERARSQRRVEEKLAEMSGRLTQMEGRVVAGDRQVEALRQQLVQRDRQVERLRAEMLERQQDEVHIRREALLQLLGLPAQAALDPEDLPRLLHQAEADRNKLTEELASLRAEQGERDRLAGEAERHQAELKAELQKSQAQVGELRELVRHREEEVAEKISWLEALDAEAEEIRRRAKEAQQQVELQQKRVAELEQDRSQRGQARSDAEAMLRTLREENEGLKIALQRLGVELENRRAEIRAWEAEKLQILASGQERENRLTEELRRGELLRQTFDEEHGRLQQAEGRNCDLVQEQATQRAENDRWQGKCRELEAEQGRLRQQLEAAREQEQGWWAERELLQAEAASRQEELQHLQHSLTQETGRNAGISRTVSEQVERNRELELDLVSLFNRIENGEVREHDRARVIKELEGRLNRQHQELEEAREKIDELTHELYQARQHEEDLTAAIELMRGALEEQGQNQEQLQRELSSLRQDGSNVVQELEEKGRNVELAMLRAERDLAEGDEVRKRAERTAEEFQAEAVKLRKEVQRLQDRLAEALDRLAEVGAARVKLVDVERELAWNREEVQRLAGELADGREELDRAEREQERAQQEATELHDELGRLVQEKRQADAQLAEFRQEAAQAESKRQAEEAQRQQARDRESELERAVREREKQFEDLNRSLSARGAELEESRNELVKERAARQEEAERGAWRQELQAAKASLEQLQQQRAEAELKSLDLERAVQLKEGQMQGLRRQLDERARDLDEARRKLEEEKIHGGRLAEELDRLRLSMVMDEDQTRLAEASERERALLAQVGTLQDQMKVLSARHSAEISGFGSELRRRDEGLRALTGRLAEIEARAQQAEARCQEPEGPAVQPGKAAAGVSADNDPAALLRQALAASRAELERVRVQAQGALENLQHTVAERDAQLRILGVQLADRGGRITRLSEELAALKQR